MDPCVRINKFLAKFCISFFLFLFSFLLRCVREGGRGGEGEVLCVFVVVGIAGFCFLFCFLLFVLFVFCLFFVVCFSVLFRFLCL